MSEPGRNRNVLVLAVLAVLAPAVLGGGWLLGRIEPPPAPATGGADGGGPQGTPGRLRSASFGASADGARSSWTTYDAAIAESRGSGKPVLVDFNAEWCPPCQALKRSVFDDAARGAAVERAVVPVSIVDRRREEGSNPAPIDELQRRYDVEAFPTLVVFSPATGRKESRRGFGDPDQMLQWIEEAARRVR